ncbi:MAG: hypothetical protein RJA44_1202 [Pseudomonadota bacterium]|jgi:pyrroloquinoline quinone biosynthesis protein B
MKLIVLKGGEERVAVPGVMRAGVPTRAPGAVAVSGCDQQWILLNVSPSVASQLSTDARLLRHQGLPDAAARAVVLTDAQLDHVTGLLSLRDGAPIHLYATPAVFEALTQQLPVLPMLQHYCGVHWHVIPVAGECRTAVFRVDGQPHIEFTAVAVDSPLPPHAARSANPVTGDGIAIAIRDQLTGQRFFCANQLAGLDAEAAAWMHDADCVIVGDDQPAAGPADAVPIDLLGLLAEARARRKLLLRHAGQDEHEPWHADDCLLLRQRGIELASDRQEIEL